MASFLRLEINTKLRCEVGWESKAVLRPGDLAGPHTEVLSVEDPESLSFSVPRYLKDGSLNANVAALRAQRVACIVLQESKTSIDYREYRLRGPIRDGRGERGLVSVTAQSLLLDLARCGPITDITNGLPHTDFDLSGKTVTEVLQDYVIQYANLPWLDLGIVDSLYEFEELAIQNVTPMALMETVRDTLRQKGFPSERRLRRNGSTNYLLDLRDQLNASVTAGYFTPERGMPSLSRVVDPTEQATRVIPVPAADPDGEPGLLGRARWRVASVDTGANTFVPEDPNGGASPIAFVNQYVLPSPWWVYRVRTGETWPIVSSDPTDGFGVANVRSLTAGEWIELRRTEPETNTRYIRWGDFGSRAPERAFFQITAVDTASTPHRLTISRPWGNETPLAVDDQYDGWTARLLTKVAGPLNAFADVNAGQYYTLASVTGYQADDLVVAATAAAAPYNIAEKIARVTSVDVPNLRLNVSALWAGGLAVASVANYAGTRIYRALRSERILGSDQATPYVEVANAAGVSVGDALYIEQPLGAGDLPHWVEHPIYAQPDPIGYGIQAASLDTPESAGLTQLIENPWMREWSGAASTPPDGWSTGTGTTARNADPLFTERGGYSLYVANWTNVVIGTPPFFVSMAPGRLRVSVRARVYLTEFTIAAGSSSLMLRLYALRADGTIDGNFLGTHTVYPTDSGIEPMVPTGEWVTMAINGVEIPERQGAHGFIARIEPAGVVYTNPKFYLDSIDAWAHTQVPEDRYLEFGDAPAITQRANRHLDEYGFPERIETSLQNLAGIDPARFADLRLDDKLGAAVPVRDLEYDIDRTLRLFNLTLRHDAPMESGCTLARRSPLLSDLARR